MQNYLLVKLQKTILKIVKNQKIGKNLTAQLNNSESNIAQYLKENDEMTVIQKMLGKCRKLKGKLFDRRITKCMKISGGDNSRELRQCVKTNLNFQIVYKTSYSQNNSIVTIFRDVTASIKKLKTL